MRLPAMFRVRPLCRILRRFVRDRFRCRFVAPHRRLEVFVWRYPLEFQPRAVFAAEGVVAGLPLQLRRRLHTLRTVSTQVT